MDVFGTVLRETYGADHPVYYVVERDDLYISVSDAQMYFMEPEEFPDLELELLDLAKGDCLELACGAGRVSLLLQERGFTVLATDKSEQAVEISKNRGVRYTKEFDFTNPKQFLFLPDKYETVLIFGNSLPVLSSVELLIEWLNYLWQVTTDDAKVLGDFLSPVPISDDVHLRYHEMNREKNRPIGKIKIRIRYQNLIGEWFDFWLPTKDEFLKCVEQTSWKAVLRGKGHFYFILSK